MVTVPPIYPLQLRSSVMRQSILLAGGGFFCIVGLGLCQETPGGASTSPMSDDAIRELLKTPVERGYFDAKMLEAERERERARREAELRAAEAALRNLRFPPAIPTPASPPPKSSDTVKSPPPANPDKPLPSVVPTRKPTEAELQEAINKARAALAAAHQKYIAANNAVTEFERKHGIPTLPREAQERIAAARLLRDVVDPNMPIRTIKDPSGFDSPRPPKGPADITDPDRGTNFFPGRNYSFDIGKLLAEKKAAEEAKAAAAKKAREREYLEIQRQQERGLLDAEASAIESDDQKLRSRRQTLDFKAMSLKGRIDAHNKAKRVFQLPDEQAMLDAFNARAASLNAEKTSLVTELQDILSDSSRLQKRKSEHAMKLTAHQQKWASFLSGQ